MTKQTNNKMVVKVLRVVSAVLVFAVALECFARFEDAVIWGAPFWGLSWKGDLLTHDDKGNRGKPNGRYQKWKLNRWGFRGPDISLKKKNGTARVMVVGASETFGLFETEGMEFPRQTQRILDRSHPGRFEVINAAWAGMSIPMASHNFEVWLKQFAPDFVVIYPSPQFYLNEEPPRLRLFRIDTDPSVFMPRIWQKTKGLAPQFLPMWVREKIWQHRLDRQIKGRPERWFWQQPPTDRVALLLRHLNEFIDRIEREDIGVLLASHANRFGEVLTLLDEQLLLSIRSFYPRATGRDVLGFERLVNARIRQLAKRRKLPFINVHDYVGKDPSYFIDSSHFTDGGAGRVAEVMARHILEAADLAGTHVSR